MQAIIADPSNLIFGLLLVVLMAGFFIWFVIESSKRNNEERNYLLLEQGLVRKLADYLDVDLEQEAFRLSYEPNKSKVRREIENRIVKQMEEKIR